jgi:glycosyltransferase involved in cell wall biosynthesis
MKVIAILDNLIGMGGGFDQSLNAIVQMQRLSSSRFEFEVLTIDMENVDFLRRLGIKATTLKMTILDRFVIRFSQSRLWKKVQIRYKLIGPLEQKLLDLGCDVVYFISPTGALLASLQKLNYITTLWDLCHRETPEFPEVRYFDAFFSREQNFKHTLGPALLILTESERLADIASQYYGINRDRFLAMPLSPTTFIQDVHAINKEGILEKYGFKEKYFFYPAQFWPHKNHIRILQALVKLRDIHGWTPKVVFTGKDYGNLNYIKNFTKINRIEEQVDILGFVPSEDLRGLYENAMAVVMPSYFGPTNIPPLESWSLGVPLIYSSQLAEQAGNAALLVDPDSSEELVSAMLQCRKLDVRAQLIRAGYIRFAEISKQRKTAEKKLIISLERFQVRRQCWE